MMPGRCRSGFGPGYGGHPDDSPPTKQASIASALQFCRAADDSTLQPNAQSTSCVVFSTEYAPRHASALCCATQCLARSSYTYFCRIRRLMPLSSCRLYGMLHVAGKSRRACVSMWRQSSHNHQSDWIVRRLHCLSVRFHVITMLILTLPTLPTPSTGRCAATTSRSQSHC